jgi:MFS transporter, MHS family, citrate/tricarballylate:H+ symporter
MYDFMIFGYFADAIARTFFPSRDPMVALLSALATFGAGFLMRPLGAIVLGIYTDRHGRRAGLILTLLLMSVGIVTLTATPSYVAIGAAAPLLVVAGRLVQGFSAGAELGNASVFLSEIAPPQSKGLYVSWQSSSQQVAVMFAALVGYFLAETLTPSQLADWGWRVPLAIGCVIIPLLFLLRRDLRETDVFLARTRRPSVHEILVGLWASRGTVALGMMLVLMTTVSFYTITAYTPTFGKLLHLPASETLVITGLIGLSNFVWLPVMGMASDRIGRLPILIVASVLAILTAYPALSWLAATPSLTRLVIVELWLSALYASYNAAMVVYLTEIIPEDVRASGFSLAYSLATAIGGFTPFIVTWLIAETGDRGIPGAWLSGAAVLSLIAILLTMRRPRANERVRIMTA